MGKNQKFSIYFFNFRYFVFVHIPLDRARRDLSGTLVSRVGTRHGTNRHREQENDNGKN